MNKENFNSDLETARGWLEFARKNNNELAIQILETLIPELAESEDERVRKILIRLFTANNVEDYGGVTNKQIVAWLEKQQSRKHNPYKAAVEAISDMVEKYVTFDANLQDFYDNVKAKCKDAMEYDSTLIELATDAMELKK